MYLSKYYLFLVYKNYFLLVESGGSEPIIDYQISI